ncbi:cytochrome C biogenesis protein [Pedobacter psychrophilus]|uniref:Cytochrome C biogenesis protein n=1 Tax=Pedobacter psychrophilus TaxID=1826909 RepID=A0A179DIE0_9SPHI|nr:cytochrome c biogenesis protein CcsA [Pedobacter psychrophilus]OAQ40718.1 cytochrome C biogenesis protein [Pedobacter psychrophilus]
MDIQFAGEHLLPGRIGQFFIVLSFGTSLIALISYYFATVTKDKLDLSWHNLARFAYRLNLFAVIGIGVCLFYIIYSHYFEYHYAYAHSSKTLPVYYIISCFWEGQEGSFWLWTFWQGVLGCILIVKAKSWENSVMTVISLSQFFLTTMLLGVEILGVKIGSSPFILLRQAIDIPIFSRADYLSLIQDGNGLNPLLQNYWMVIHPPTLFLGFASMVVPFSYGIAALWQKRYSDWVKPALPWALFAVMVLGTGIIMGSFWAYEALNFGGFWAWDPVENASIIPWLTLIAGVHVMIAYKNSGHSYFTAIFLIIISFILVLYASFLTRSGILGDTSVHAFTDLGMSGQLLIYMFAFIILATVLIIINWKKLPITKKDEDTYSREFWLFIGAIVLVVSCIQIIATTSIPVYNKIFGASIAPPINVIQHYNKWQIAFAFAIATISAFSQFLKYKKTDVRKFLISLGVSFVMAILLTAIVVYITQIYQNVMYVLMTWAAIFSILCNARLLGDAFKGKWKLSGSAVAHIGFAFILIGALIAAANNKVISTNNTGIGFGDEFAKNNNPRENIILYKNEPTKMAEYTVTYLGDSTSGVNTYYRVNYKVINPEGKVKENFNLYPNAQQNAKMKQIIASPDTKHYLLHDVYTHVSSVPLKEDEHDDHEGHSDDENYQKPIIHEVSVGDTVRFRQGFLVVKSINKDATIKDIPLTKGDVAIGMNLEIEANNAKFKAEPIFLIKGNTKVDFGKKVDEAGLKLRFTNILPEKDKLELTVYEKPKEDKRDWIVLKAITFPYINLFWGGTIIMIIGFLLSIFRRAKDVKTA